MVDGIKKGRFTNHCFCVIIDDRNVCREGGKRNDKRKKELFFRTFDEFFAASMYTDHYDYIDLMAVQSDCQGAGTGHRGYEASIVCGAVGRSDGGNEGCVPFPLL